MNSGLSSNIQNDLYPIPKFNDSKYFRYRELLQVKLGYKFARKELTQLQEENEKETFYLKNNKDMNDIETMRFENMPSVMRHIIELDEVDYFNGYLNYVRENLCFSLEEFKENSSTVNIIYIIFYLQVPPH